MYLGRLGRACVSLIILPIIIAASPVEITSFKAITPSGKADVLFKGVEVKAVAALLAEACMDRGWSVQQQDETTVVCERPIGSTEARLQMLMLPRGAKVHEFVRFSIVATISAVRVQAAGYTEESNVFGQVKRTEIGKVQDLQDLLLHLGGQFLPGTSFKGADIGVRGILMDEGHVIGLKIVTIEPASPAERSGLQVGDFITQVNNKDVTLDPVQFRDLFRKVQTGQSFKLSVIRNGQLLSTNIIGEIRSVVIADQGA